MNKTELEEHIRESGEENLVIRINGWLGSGGEGMVVMDDLRVKQVNITELELLNINNTMMSLGNNSKCSQVSNIVYWSRINSHQIHKCQDYEPGNCSARFTRYYYSLSADACIKFQWSGCGGNSNRHTSEEACLETCTAADPGEGEVTTSADVTLANEVCALEAESGNCTVSSSRYHFSPEAGACVAFTYSGCQVIVQRIPRCPRYVICNFGLIFQGNANNFHTEQDCQQFCSEVMLNVSEGELTTTAITTTTASSTESTTATTLMSSEDNVSVVTATLNMKTNYSECSLPPEKGTCSESLTRFHYVPELEKCIPFLFSGCKVILE